MIESTDISNLYYAIREIISGVIIVTMIPMLINCFFGYKIQKFMITLGGVISGAFIGIIVGLVNQDETIGIIAAIFFAIICGFIAFKIYKVGVFLYYWLLGSLFLLAIFFIMEAYDLLVVAFVFGIFIGAFAVIMNKWFIIITTAFSGGMISGTGLAFLFEVRSLGFVFGIIISIFGLIVQCILEKKNKEPKENNIGQASQGTQETQGNTNLLNNMTESITETVKVNKFTELSKSTPDYYCPKSKLLIDLVTLSKNDMNSVSANIDFINIGEESLIAIYCKIIGYDIAGDKLGEQTYNIIDIDIKPNTRFNSGQIALSDNAIRKVDIIITKIVKGNYEVEKFQDIDTVKLPEPIAIGDSIPKDVAEFIKIKVDEKYLYTPLENDLWICTCGHIGNEKCYHCGRTSKQVLKNTDTDIIIRIQDKINVIESNVNKCLSLFELDAYQKDIEKIGKLLVINEIYTDLISQCEAVTSKIKEKHDELKQRNTKIKNKTKKIVIIASIAIVAILTILGIAKTIMGMAPSDSKIKHDIEDYLQENIGENFKVKEIEIKKETVDNSLSADVEVEAKDSKNKDLLEATITIIYRKYEDKYEISYCVTDQYTISPDHELGKNENFLIPDLSISAGGEHIYIDSDNIDEYIKDENFEIEFKVNYDKIKFEDSKASVPVSITIDYLNSYYSEEFEVEYKYRGNYNWKCTETLDITINPKDGTVKEELFKNLIAEETINVHDEDVSCEYLTYEDFHIYYDKGYTKAELNSHVHWDNSFIKFSGFLTANFEYTDGKWKLSDYTLDNLSEPVRYNDVSDATLIKIITPIIQENCEYKENISNITISKKDNVTNGLKVTAEYNADTDDFLLRQSVEIYLDDSLVGYKFSSVGNQSNISYTLKNEIHEDISVNYILNCTDTTPNGVAKSGSTTARLDVDSNCNVKITINFGEINLNIQGTLSYSGGTLRLNDISKNINVNYNLFGNYDADITYDIKSYLNYSSGNINGKIEFDTIAAGVDDFYFEIN